MTDTSLYLKSHIPWNLYIQPEFSIYHALTMHWKLYSCCIRICSVTTYFFLASQSSPGNLNFIHHNKISNISHTKYHNLNVSHLILQLSLPNPLKPGVKSRMKMQLEQRRQAVLQLHLSDQQFYCLKGASYIRGLILTCCSLVVAHFMTLQNLVNTGLDNGLLPTRTKPLPEPMWINHQWGFVTFTCGKFHRKCSIYLSLAWVWKLHIED